LALYSIVIVFPGTIMVVVFEAGIGFVIVNVFSCTIISVSYHLAFLLKNLKRIPVFLFRWTSVSLFNKELNSFVEINDKCETSSFAI